MAAGFLGSELRQEFISEVIFEPGAFDLLFKLVPLSPYFVCNQKHNAEIIGGGSLVVPLGVA